MRGFGQAGISGGILRPSKLSPAALLFAALVVATVAAFFVTTRLKRSAPVIESLTGVKLETLLQQVPALRKAIVEAEVEDKRKGNK